MALIVATTAIGLLSCEERSRLISTTQSTAFELSLAETIAAHGPVDVAARVEFTVPPNPDGLWVLVSPMATIDDLSSLNRIGSDHAVEFLHRNAHFEIEKMALYRLVHGEIVEYNYLSTTCFTKAPLLTASPGNVIIVELLPTGHVVFGAN